MDVNEDDEEEEAKEGGRNKRPFKEKSGKMCVVCPWLHGIKKGHGSSCADTLAKKISPLQLCSRVKDVT